MRRPVDSMVTQALKRPRSPGSSSPWSAPAGSALISRIATRTVWPAALLRDPRKQNVRPTAVFFGRISETAADLCAWFDQSQTNRAAGAFQEIRGRQRAARAAAAIERASAYLDGGNEASVGLRCLIVRKGLTNVY